mmetsp:Transcript_24695/g.56751  ORF Transcript_24695/g.56751 Transcript_24695/m.56751 type:complete len:203 (-) Transcript_24695:794-1402(-)
MHHFFCFLLKLRQFPTRWLTRFPSLHPLSNSLSLFSLFCSSSCCSRSRPSFLRRRSSTSLRLYSSSAKTFCTVRSCVSSSVRVRMPCFLARSKSLFPRWRPASTRSTTYLRSLPARPPSAASAASSASDAVAFVGCSGSPPLRIRISWARRSTSKAASAFSAKRKKDDGGQRTKRGTKTGRGSFGLPPRRHLSGWTRLARAR